MRASEFTDNRVMAKIEHTGQIVQILRHENQVKFSDEPGWFLVNTEPGLRTGTGIKWIPDSTRFTWVKKFDSLEESLDRPYPLTWEKSEADDSVDALARLPDGSNLSIMFNQDLDDEGEGIYSVEFWRGNSQEVTGAGDSQRVFATVLAAIAQFIKKRQPEQLYFSANKDVEPGQKAGTRSNLYTSLVRRYARALGYEADVSDFAGSTTYKLHKLYEQKQPVTEARMPRAIEEFLDSLNPDDCGVEDIGPYRIHFEGFTSDCKSSSDYRRNPEAVYQQVYADFIKREGGARPVVQDMVGDENFPILYSIFRRRQKVAETQQATAKQVLNYINKTHHEPFRPGEKMYRAVMAHPQWQLQRVPLLNLNLPDQEYDDVDYYDNPPESDPYGRVMTVEPEHAGEVSQYLVDKNPIVIDSDRYIIDGNHRAWAAKYLLNRDYIDAWVPVTQLKEVNYPDELTVSDQIQQYFFKRGYSLAGEGRDQMAFESPRGTIVKVLGTGEDEREQVVKRYVKFFEQNQQNPFYPRIFNSGNFTVDGETYFVYEMERVNYVANEEATLDYIEKLMSAVDRGQGAEYVKKNPVPDEIGVKQLAGLLQATEHMMQALGGTAPLDLSAVENLGRRDNGHLVIVDPYSL